MDSKQISNSPLCDSCKRKRSKVEEHLAGQGLVECRLKGVDAGVVMEAFYSFASSKRADRPFVVEGRSEAVAAWPFQFHPSAIRRCDGHKPVDGGDE